MMQKINYLSTKEKVRTKNKNIVTLQKMIKTAQSFPKSIKEAFKCNAETRKVAHKIIKFKKCNSQCIERQEKMKIK